MPPTDQIWHTFRTDMLPAFVAAAVVLALLAWLSRGRETVVHAGAALALPAGLFAGMWFSDTLPFVPGPSAWQWLPAAVLVVQAAGWVGLLPRVPTVAGWLVRAAAAGLAGWLLTPADLRAEYTWAPAAFAAVVLAEWAVWDRFARTPESPLAASGLAFVYLGAAAVLIHAHSARFMDVAVILAASLAGVAAAAWRRPTNAAVPGALAALAGLMLSGFHETYSDVPPASFLLTALAPAAPALAFVPPLHRRQTAWLTVLRLVLLAVPVVVAVALAARAESLDFE